MLIIKVYTDENMGDHLDFNGWPVKKKKLLIAVVSRKWVDLRMSRRVFIFPYLIPNVSAENGEEEDT